MQYRFKYLSILVLFILAAAIPLTLSVLKQQQIRKQGAATCSGAISGIVFQDNDENGIYNPSPGGTDFPLSGWTVNLTKNSVNINTTSSDGSGAYSFSNLCDGTYLVQVVPHNLYHQTAPSGGSYQLTISGGNNFSSKNFGYNTGGTSCNTFILTGNISVLGGGVNIPYGGATITLLSNSSNQRTTTSDAFGNYVFLNVTPGNYTVSVSVQAPLSNPQSQTITVSNNISVDFTLPAPTDMISGNVFGDLNSNGIKDTGEGPLYNAGISITGPKSVSVVTDYLGDYLAYNLLDGTYTIDVSGATTSHPLTVTLSQSPSVGNNFGVHTANNTLYSVSGTISAPASVLTTVLLRGPVNKTTTTPQNYSFTNLPPGTYTVIAEPPSGYTIAYNLQTVVLPPDASAVNFSLTSCAAPTNTPSPTATITPTPVATNTPSPTTTPFPTNTSTPSPTDTVSPSPTATVIPTDTPSVTPTPTTIPTDTPAPTNTPVPHDTQLALTLFLHGVGFNGDNANPSSYSLGNLTPLHPERPVEIDVYDSTNHQLYSNSTGSLVYSSTTGNFSANVDLGPNIVTGDYQIYVKSDRYLRKSLAGIVQLTQGVSNSAPVASLIAGDVNGDNQLDILDYNALLDCGYGQINALPMQNPNSIFNTSACQAHQNTAPLTDINDDGIIDGRDFNLFIRELSVQTGD